MTVKSVVAVVGATGQQGGGLARAILKDASGPFALRALTRNPEGEKAAALKRQGAQVAAADLDDAESLERAFAGADAAFCVTNFWEHFDPEREKRQAANMANAAKAAGLRLAIWSTLDDSRKSVPLADPRMPTLMGRYKVPHFDAKAEADAFFAESGVATVYLHTSFYWDNLIAFGMAPTRGPDGKLVFTLPMGDRKLPGIAAEDIGRCAYGILKRGQEFAGKTVGIAGEHLSGAEMAAALSRVMGEPVAHNAIGFDAFRALGFPGAEDLGNMFQFKHDFNDAYRRSRDVALSRALNPELMTFETWLRANAGRIPKA